MDFLNKHGLNNPDEITELMKPKSSNERAYYGPNALIMN